VVPCLDAWRTQQEIRIDHVDDVAGTYPAFAASCRDHEVLSTLSLPLVTADTGIGTLNLYAREPTAFTEDDQAIGAPMAAAAAVVVANVAAYWTAFELGQNLTQAMGSSAVIEQAKGMLMAPSPDLTPDAAFELLRQASQRENVKLRDLALRIVARRPPPSR
jgi:transcriptional regulator with GAF, ATPase, and Fis domain